MVEPRSRAQACDFGLGDAVLHGGGVSARTFSLSLGVMLVLALAGCSHKNPDPRALPRADTSATLESTASKFGIHIPESVHDVKFATYSTIDTGGVIRYEATCEDIAVAVRKSGFAKLSPSPPALYLQSTARQYDWSLPEVAMSAEDESGSWYRAITYFPEAGSDCILLFAGYL